MYNLVQEIVAKHECKRFKINIRTSENGLQNYLNESGAKFEHVPLDTVNWLLATDNAFEGCESEENEENISTYCGSFSPSDFEKHIAECDICRDDA